MTPIRVFDIETSPDVEGLRALAVLVVLAFLHALAMGSGILRRGSVSGTG